MTKLHLILFTLPLSYSLSGQSAIWNLGPSYDYTTPNGLYLADASGDIDISDSDTIYIEKADYSGTDALAAWQQNNLFIQGMGPIGDRPHMIADGEYILGKGIWVCVGNNITISNIEFSGATVPDENGAGIRLDGIGLTISHCYFHDNENGILTSNPYDGDILFEYSEFANNGFGDGFTHNMYIGHVNNFTMRYCYSHHTNVGHNVKSRANNNVIAYNRIMDEETGNSSRLIDIPNGGYTLIIGNNLMQGPAALNNNAVGYGKEGMTNPDPHQFYFLYNTIVNKREASCNYLDIEAGASDVYIANNIFAGTGNLLVGDATTLFYNYQHDNIAHFEFADEASYDYRIGSTSPVIDSGLVIMDDLDAEFYYQHPLNGWPRIMAGDRPDIGAYEYIYPIGFPENENSNILLYPNPSKGSFQIKTQAPIDAVKIVDLQGKLLYESNVPNNTFEFLHPAGIYIIYITVGGLTSRQKLILN